MKAGDRHHKYLGMDEAKGVEFLDDGQQNPVGDSNRVKDKEG
jgi:hypothetical protein